LFHICERFATKTNEKHSTMTTQNSDLEQKIIKQVDFYFSDSNLPYDKFLRSLVANHPEGYVEIKTIASFKRMKMLTEDLKIIAEALTKSKNLEVDSTGTMVRRIAPLPETDTTLQRSIYAKGLPQDSTIQSVEDLFNKYGKVTCVRLRRHKTTKDFKGSAFIEFETEEQAKEIIGKKVCGPDGKELIIKPKKDYLEEKKKENIERRQRIKQEKEAQKKEEAKKSLGLVPGTVVKITNFEPEKEEMTVKELKDALTEVFKDNFAYVEWPVNEDKKTMFVRFKTAEATDAAVKDAENIKLGKAKVSITKLSEEEEKEYFDKTIEESLKKGGKKGGKKKKGNKRKAEKEEEEPNKKQKTE